jgi:lysozyme
VLLGAGAPDEPDPARHPVRGIDASHHQGEIDWPAVRAAGFRFAFLKASEGAEHRDRRFARNWSEAGAAGLARGAYHYFTFCADGARQARNFLAARQPLAGALPPVVDVELEGNCAGWTRLEDVRAELRRFLAAVEAAWGRRPILYLTAESLERIVAGHFDGHPLWLRALEGKPPDAGWLFWQYSDAGRVAGVRGRVDLNVFRGDADAFERLLGAAGR